MKLRYSLALLVPLILASCGTGARPGSASPATAAIQATKALASPADPASTLIDAQGVPMQVLKANDPQVCYIEPTAELKKKLSPEQYAVLVEAATEPPFRNPYWNLHDEGIFVDALDGTALFASTTKFDSGTGWPSFWKPIDPAKIELIEDDSLGMRRIEVRAKASGGHLGHLFDDGPKPTGLRYCINSASLRFVPRASLAAEGYGALEALFAPGK